MDRRFVLLAVALLVGACASEPVPEAVAPPPAETPPVQQDNRPAIVALGDSITAGSGVRDEESYPSVLERELNAAGYNYRVVNAGVGGDTTSGGRTRLPAVAVHSPELVIVELGGNDGLRGLPVETTRANLGEIVGALRDSGAKVLLVGMTLPPNYGAQYIGQFEQVFADVAEKFDVPLLPFRVDEFAGLMQDDAIHPNPEGHRKIALQLMGAITPMLATPANR